MAHTKLYYAALIYAFMMAIAGLYMRAIYPETPGNQAHYVGYLAVLSALWPITVIANLTDDKDGF